MTELNKESDEVVEQIDRLADNPLPDEAAMKSFNEMKAAIDYISKYQVGSIIRFLLYRKIMQCNDNKKRGFLLRELFESIPPTEMGSNMLDNGIYKYYATFKPCSKTHDLTNQYSMIDAEMISKFNFILSQVILQVRKNYTAYLDDYEYMKDMLTSELPKGKKDISIKVDPSNTTLYIDEDDEIRMGIFIERNDVMTQIQNHETILEFADIMEQNSDNNKMNYIIVSYLAVRAMIWQYYMTEYSRMVLLGPSIL